MQLPSRARAGHCRVLSVLSSRLAVGKNQLSSDCFFFRSHPQDSLLPPSHFLPLSVSIIKSVHSLMKEDDILFVGLKFTKINIIDAGTFIVIPSKHCLTRIEKRKHSAARGIQMYKGHDNPYESSNKVRIVEKPPPHLINLGANGREVSWDPKGWRITAWVQMARIWRVLASVFFSRFSMIHTELLCRLCCTCLYQTYTF